MLPLKVCQLSGILADFPRLFGFILYILKTMQSTLKEGKTTIRTDEELMEEYILPEFRSR